MKNLNKKLMQMSFLLIIGLIFGLKFYQNIPTTLSRYESEGTSTPTMTAAAWVFNLTGETNDVVNVNLNSTLDQTSISKYGDKIVPGSSGVITFTINTTGSEVALKYMISKKTSPAPNLPPNLEFYTDSSFTTKLTTISKEVPLANVGTSTENIYWRWNFTSNDDSAWQNQNVSVSFNIEGEQLLG